MVDGTIVLPTAGSGTLTGTTNINYPSGFNRTNCVVSSLMGNCPAENNWYLTASETSTRNYLLGCSGLVAMLQDGVIRVDANKPDDSASSRTYNFKLVLMKL